MLSGRLIPGTAASAISLPGTVFWETCAGKQGRAPV